MDVDRVHEVDPAKSMFETKAKVRRMVEAKGIPYTSVSNNCMAGNFLPSLSQQGYPPCPPRDKVTILGDGQSRAIFVSEEDVAVYTIKSVDDPRTLDKILYVRPPANIDLLNGGTGFPLGEEDREDTREDLCDRGGSHKQIER
ncbi:hypothetical protein H6P81_005607 [Aristolochia fimbriata]|uniref:NmrA-like domain-containing protein n=1 Tax=Aristolochia fimbriata TaxID=158543 RepID=A0AAV7EZF9_ARIFI|nr:hypothetical protein H6P81_005607 [Aristolochia fimbriata]